jgi:hypothetical protein
MCCADRCANKYNHRVNITTYSLVNAFSLRNNICEGSHSHNTTNRVASLEVAAAWQEFRERLLRSTVLSSSTVMQ